MCYGYVWLFYLLGWENYKEVDNLNVWWIGVIFISVLMGLFVVLEWLLVLVLIVGSLFVIYFFGYFMWGKC